MQSSKWPFFLDGNDGWHVFKLNPVGEWIVMNLNPLDIQFYENQQFNGVTVLWGSLVLLHSMLAVFYIILLMKEKKHAKKSSS